MKDKEIKTKNAARWGTPNWIATWPWSRMDRKRRRRAERAVGEETVKDLKSGPFTCCLMSRLETVMSKYGVRLPAKVQKKLETALLTASGIERDIYDEAFGRALATAWRIKR